MHTEEESVQLKSKFTSPPIQVISFNEKNCRHPRQSIISVQSPLDPILIVDTPKRKESKIVEAEVKIIENRPKS